MHVGMIGLGQMGKPIAWHLHKKCRDFKAFVRNPGARSELIKGGMSVTPDLHCMSDIDLLFLCLPQDNDILDVLMGERGLAKQLKEGSHIVDLGTTSYSTTLTIKEHLDKRSIAFMDAPITGMARRAIAGTLTVMCGGTASMFEEVKPFLAMFCQDILLMGEHGAGQLTKLINQILFDINLAALAEILPLSVKLGLNAETVGKVINSGTGRSFASEFFIPNILQGSFQNGPSLRFAYKDLVNAADLSMTQRLPLPLTAAATATYMTAIQKGFGDLDKGGMVRVFEELFDVQFRA